MKKLLLICFLLIIFLVITVGVNAQYMWSAGSASEGSMSYVWVGALCETVSNYSDDIFMTPIPYTTSLAQLKGFDQKEVDSAYGNSQVISNIINEKGPFDPETYKWTAPVSQMMWVYNQDYFFLTRKEDADKIKSWSDLANKKVWAMTAGSGAYEIFKLLSGPKGLNIWDTLDIKSFEKSHAADALKLGQVDAILAYSASGQIVSWAEEVVQRTDCVMLAPTPEELEVMLESNKFVFVIETEPGGKGQDLGLTKTVKNPGLAFPMIVHPDLPEEIVYEVVKTAFEHSSEMADLVTIWRTFAKDPAEFNLPYLKKFKELGLPIHPGALRYFRELGYDTIELGLE